MGYLDLDDSERVANRPDLHLQRPAPSPIIHLKLHELAEMDRTERRQVAKRSTVKETDHRCDQTVAETRVPAWATGLLMLHVSLPVVIDRSKLTMRI